MIPRPKLNNLVPIPEFAYLGFDVYRHECPLCHGKGRVPCRDGDILVQGFRFYADEAVPEGVIEMRDSESGKLIGKIVNIGSS